MSNVRRILLALLLLLAVLPGSAAATDSLQIKFRQFGLGGFYSFTADPVWLQLSLKNSSAAPLSFRLAISELNLYADDASLADVLHSQQTLAPGEQRILNVPLNLAPADVHTVIFIEAIASDGSVLARVGHVLGTASQGRLVAIICGTPQACDAIQQAVYLTGSPEVRNNRSRDLRVVQLTDPPPVSWAYSRAYVVILAAPVSTLSSDQRDALEAFMLRGGNLVLLEDQLGETRNTPQFLAAYRTHYPQGRIAPVALGHLLRLQSSSLKNFSPLFFDFSNAGFEEVETDQSSAVSVRSFGNFSGDLPQLRWLMARLGTTFHFPSFYTLLFCTLAYILSTGVVNFVILRRMGRPEIGWLSIPGFALLFSLLLYLVAVRTHPSNFGLDQMTVFQMTDLSPLATSRTVVRVSSPSRSLLRLSVPADAVQSENPATRSIDGPQISFGGGVPAYADVDWSNGARQIDFSLRRWSFRDFDFRSQRRLPGTIYRDSTGHLHNESGLPFHQAILVDQDDVYVFSELPAGAVLDLARATRIPYESATGRIEFPYPGPPFVFRHSQPRDNRFRPEDMQRFADEFKALPNLPFSVLELVRGWTRSGDSVFSETKAVFFGLSESPPFGASLVGRSPNSRSGSLVVVTFGVWP